LSIFLVGPMGAGKSAIGRALARELGLDFHDTDSEIQARTGVDIGFIFEKEGEAGFRVRERTALSDLVKLPDIVLATGGGAVLDPHNRSDLAANGTVIYLETTVAQQLRRTGGRAHRPLLDTADPEARLTTLLEERDPLYRGIADLVIPTDDRRVGEVVQLIIGTLDDGQTHG
jgi:shikimate kinase